MDGIRGRYSSSQGDGTFVLMHQQEPATQLNDMSRQELIDFMATQQHAAAQTRTKFSHLRRAEDETRASTNLLQLDKQNLQEEVVQLRLRAESAEAKIDSERAARAQLDSKCDRLSELMLGYKLREEALVRQLQDKEATARRAVTAFHGLRAECAQLLGAAANAAFDEDGAELRVLQTKLSELSKQPGAKPAGADQNLDAVDRITAMSDKLEQVQHEAEEFAIQHTPERVHE
eukprot:TRINITY_DN24856_c0_g2_i1.p1 TRINITY_DN24856_c0_g2~~TRINITY_DN24856_c0_g2_i1.p1  ORF type:complete len:232 (+),score=72.23 TRINITY_DN24856_c0_g2_i1:279-974(+)